MIAKRQRFRRKALQDPEVESDSGDEDVDLVKRQGTTLYFYASVTPRTILKLVRHLEDAVRVALVSDVPHVTLHIHSWGGCAFAGLTAHDMIRRARVPVHTVANGFCASAGTFLLLGGERRFALPNTLFLVHQLSTGMEGKLAELVEEVNNSKVTQKVINAMYHERTGLQKKDVKDMVKKETLLSYERALAAGFIEGVPRGSIAPPPKGSTHGTSTNPVVSSGNGHNSHVRWS